MITYEEARRIALEHANQGPKAEGDEFIVLDALTIAKDYGWIFSTTSKRFHQTGDPRDAIVGQGPLVVEKEGGRVVALGSAHPIDERIREYEARREKA
jgi:hypothetical protein